MFLNTNSIINITIVKNETNSLCCFNFSRSFFSKAIPAIKNGRKNTTLEELAKVPRLGSNPKIKDNNTEIIKAFL